MPIRYYQEIGDDTGGAPLRRELSIATVSDAVTLPDNPGPGCTLDRALAWGGERLEHTVTWVLSRARRARGPTSSIKDIVRAVYYSLMMPRTCLHRHWRGEYYVPCGYCGPPEITAPPTTYQLPIVFEWLVYAAHAPRCPNCGETMEEQGIRTPLKSAKKLVKLMSTSNKSSCYISLQLITLLVTMFPDSREVFVDMGAWDVLQGLSRRMSDQLDVDPLLASSRRALVSLFDSEILSLGNEIELYRSSDSASPLIYAEIIYKLIDCFSHPEKMVLALTIAHRYGCIFNPVLPFTILNTTYPMLLSQLASSSDPVEVVVLTDYLYRVIHLTKWPAPWLIPIIKTRPELLEHIPYRLRCSIDGLPAKYEQEAIDREQYWGRWVNRWRREIWQYDQDDPEGEPDNDWQFFKNAARDDGERGYAKIDAVWWEAPVWETCDRRKRRLGGRAERGMQDGERRGRDDHRGRRPRAQSMTTTAWPYWMMKRQEDQAVEWKEYWIAAEFVNFTGWPRKVMIWRVREREPFGRYWGNPDWLIFWKKLSTRMRSRSVD